MGSRFDRGHRASNYALLKQVWEERLRSMTAAEAVSALSFPPGFYPLEYEEGYEPYVIMCRAYVCPYDSAFSGYGRNKALHLYHLHRLGVRFVGCADIALMHVDHAPTSDRVRLLGAVHDSLGGSDAAGGTGAELQVGLLREIKDMYAESRQAITTHCASWALDSNILHHAARAQHADTYHFDEDVESEGIDPEHGCGFSCMFPRVTWLSQPKIGGPHQTVTRRICCAGTATAWLPNDIRQLCANLVNILSQSAAALGEEGDEGLEGVASSRTLYRVLAHLCSIHMHYEAPALHIQRYVFTSPYKSTITII
jgi:hypothetical protein